MAIETRVLIQRLTGKFGFQEAERRSDDHKWYELQLDGLPTILTKVSHGRHSIDNKIEGKIVRQLRVRKPFYHEMMGCTKSREEYYRQVREEPFPPWDVRF